MWAGRATRTIIYSRWYPLSSARGFLQIGSSVGAIMRRAAKSLGQRLLCAPCNLSLRSVLGSKDVLPIVLSILRLCARDERQKSQISRFRNYSRRAAYPNSFFCTGGVSSVGKGVTAAAIGRMLKARCRPTSTLQSFMTEDDVETEFDLGHLRALHQTRT